ncbi:MAG: hypothetical protein CSB55_00025 [Candidatus Cloacimonadota bacterium]|nr:MAG: hypothetical protein CSB55_00025 [Candidatus Cloacimonadota bacterium]
MVLSKNTAKIVKLTEEANKRWNLFEPGEKITAGISGGKDSLAMLEILRNEFNLELIPVTVDIFAEEVSQKTENGIIILKRPIMKEISGIKNQCFTCSKRKRQAILEFSLENGIKKIALGHHKDDVVETLLLNQIFSREYSAMMPKQELFGGEFEIIRPFYLVPEKLINIFFKRNKLNVLSRKCGYEDKTKRLFIKNLIREIQKKHKKINVSDNIFSAMKQVKEKYLPYDIIH